MNNMEKNIRSLYTLCLLLCGVLLVTNCTNSETTQLEYNPVESSLVKYRSGYDTAFIGAPLSDPLMQYNKETYVLYGCAYCHGINLAPVGEATDLRTSPIVTVDVNANVIGQVLRTGIPQTPKSSPMPQYSDLSGREIQAIASYIHYARARARYDDLMKDPESAGNAAAGKSYFEQNCASCHSGRSDLAGIGNKYDAVALRKQVLEPALFHVPESFKLDHRNDATVNEGRAKHQALLENHTEPNVTNIVAYLQTLK